MLYDRPVRELLRDAVSAQSGEFDRDAIRAFVAEHYPLVKRTTVDAHITSATVNDRNRRHFAAAGELLFKNAAGRYERYDPRRHGKWSPSGEPVDEAAAAHARERPPSRKPQRRHDRTQRIQDRVEDLVSGFGDYLKAFEANVGFGGPSVYFHRRTLEVLRSHGSPARAVQEESFLEYLYAMLCSWGMHRLGRGGPKLVEFDVFRNSLISVAEDVADLSGLRIEDITEERLQHVTDRVWRMMERLRVGVGETKIVVNSKTLHHLVPELVPPIDRTYTLMFLYDSMQPTGGDESLFREIYPSFWEIATRRKETILTAVSASRTPMDTSVTKVIDNAIIGFGRARRLVADEEVS